MKIVRLLDVKKKHSLDVEVACNFIKKNLLQVYTQFFISLLKGTLMPWTKNLLYFSLYKNNALKISQFEGERN